LRFRLARRFLRSFLLLCRHQAKQIPSFRSTEAAQGEAVSNEEEWWKRNRTDTATKASHSPPFSQSGVRWRTQLRVSTSSYFFLRLQETGEKKGSVSTAFSERGLKKRKRKGRRKKDAQDLSLPFRQLQPHQTCPRVPVLNRETDVPPQPTSPFFVRHRRTVGRRRGVGSGAVDDIGR
jgi:hypothetical protein